MSNQVWIWRRRSPAAVRKSWQRRVLRMKTNVYGTSYGEKQLIHKGGKP